MSKSEIQTLNHKCEFMWILFILIFSQNSHWDIVSKTSNEGPEITSFKSQGDINECDISEIEESCGALGACVNFPGGWECGCEDGFEFDEATQNCKGNLPDQNTPVEILIRSPS